MRTSDFDFEFPEELIAFHPKGRGEARMMVVERQDSGIPRSEEPILTHTRSLIDFLSPGDALVLNDTKVLRARLIGESPAGARVEALLLAPCNPAIGIRGPGAALGSGLPDKTRWQAMVKPGKRFRVGDRAVFSQALTATVVEVAEDGTRILEFDLSPLAFHSELEVTGKIPLPPYIRREAEESDAGSYQSVFAAHPGSVAAPTASLHIDQAMLDAIRAKGIVIAKVTLHVGAGTFKPVQSESLAEHVMHSERYVMADESAAALNDVRRAGGKVWAVGTTAARVLETRALGAAPRVFEAGAGETDIFIHPGYVWKGVDGLLTNFHWPKSTLFMLVSSLLGPERAKRAYAEAIAQGFRLFSYGDAMLIR